MKEFLMALTKNNIISKLTEEDRRELVEKACKKRYIKGEFICHQGEIWPNMAFISSGEVKWTLFSFDGKRQVVFGLKEGGLVLGHSLFDGNGMPASLEVITDCEVYLWPKETVAPILSRNPQALWEVMKVLVTYMHTVRNVVYGFSFHPVSRRLAGLLLKRYSPENGEVAPRDLTLDEMAAEVGTTRELICKVLHDFERERIINIFRKTIIFINKNKLEELAGEETQKETV